MDEPARVTTDCREEGRSFRTGRAMALLGLALLAGCGYTTHGLYYDSVQTVAVPIFKSQGLRRDVEFKLTEKVIQAIEAQTDYKVVSPADADTELLGKIINHVKSPFGEDPFDNPRGGAMSISVQVSWVDKRTGEVLNNGTFNFDQSFTLHTMEPFTIDLAQSQATATEQAMLDMANRIVSLMQTPW